MKDFLFPLKKNFFHSFSVSFFCVQYGKVKKGGIFEGKVKVLGWQQHFF